MPEMGESVTEGTILEWHKQEGEAVAEGDTVVEVSTDKVDAEVPAPTSGTIAGSWPSPTRPFRSARCWPNSAPARRRGARRKRGAGREEAVALAGGRGGADGTQGLAGGPPGRGGERVDVRASRLRAGRQGDEGRRARGGQRRAGRRSGAGRAVAPAGEAKPLRGPAGMLAQAMNESRSIPTATSFRTLSVDALDAKRKALNGALKERAMKVSFTHLIAWAIVEAARQWAVMGRAYAESDGKPQVIEPGGVNLGIAVDVERKDGSRSLMVPCIKGADGLDFAAFHAYYEDLINKTRENKLTADDFQGTNITLTNPGGLGTVASVPRLMAGQGTIVATGSIAYPAEWAHAPPTG